jgi:hypothetical protein
MIGKGQPLSPKQVKDPENPLYGIYYIFGAREENNKL